MFSETQPAPLHAMAGDGLDDFRVQSPPEIAALLRQLIDGAVVIHLSSPAGPSCTTTLWTLDAEQARLSFSADGAGAQLQALVDGGEATAVGYLDNIKLQFDLQELMLVHGSRASALQSALPTELFRFQRRQSFRVRTASRKGPCVRLRHPALPDMRLALRVLDVSMGGCALFLPDDVPPFDPGARLQGVRVELDADTRFDAALQLHHVTAINPQSGGARLGCAMEGLNGDANRALQRYIDQTQKRRRLLSLD